MSPSSSTTTVTVVHGGQHDHTRYQICDIRVVLLLHAAFFVVDEILGLYMLEPARKHILLLINHSHSVRDIHGVSFRAFHGAVLLAVRFGAVLPNAHHRTALFCNRAEPHTEGLKSNNPHRTASHDSKRK